MAVTFSLLGSPHHACLSYANSLKNSLSNRVVSCAGALKQFYGSYLARESPFRKSVIGCMIFGFGFETIGAVAGAAIGGSLIGAACKRLAPVIVAAGIGGALYSLRGRVALVTTAALFVPCAMVALPSAFNLMALWIGGTGAWLGANAGLVLGGYAGLSLFGSKVTLWDRSDSYRTYAVLMGVSIVAGEVFQRALSVEFPWSLLRFGRPIVQTFVYNLSSIFGICGSLFREKRLKQEVVIPLIIKSLCDKYCEKNAQPFTDKLIHMLSSTVGVIPWMEQQIQFFLKLECFQTFCQSTVDKFKGNSHKIAAALMRGFGQYMQLVKEAKNLEQLKEKIPSAPLIFVNTFCCAQTDAMAESILTSIQQTGIDLYGSPIPVDIVKMKPLFSMHIRYFLTYFLWNLDFRVLEECEEQMFISKLVDAFTSVLDQSSSSHKIIGLLGKGVQFAVPRAYFLKKHIGRFIEPPEQTALLECAMRVPADLGDVPPVHVFGRVDLSEYVRVTRESVLEDIDDHKIEITGLPALAAVAVSPIPEPPVHRSAHVDADVGKDYEHVSAEDDQGVGFDDFEDL